MRRLSIIAWMGVALLTGCGGSSKSITGESSTTSTGTGTGTTATVVPASLTAMSSTTTIPSDGSATATITVLARNSKNDLISGVTVSFASDSGGVAVTSPTTDSSGAATATLSTAGDPTARTITVTATASGLTATVKVQVTSSSSAATTAVAHLTMSSSSASILSDGSTTATISALARDASNNVLAGVPVTFAASSGAIQAAAATTDATGTVTATVSTGGDSSLRTITVTGSTASFTSTVQVQVVAPSSPTIPVYSMGNGTGTGFVANVLALAVNNSTPPTTLAAGGTTDLALTIVDQTGALYTAAPVVVTFSSPCIASGAAQILPAGSNTPVTTITTSTGSISAAYAAKGCVGADAIKASATVASQNIAATGTVTVGAASIGSIQFVSATPTTIGLKGTGLGETSTVVFKVTDSSGGPKSGVPVSFALNTSVGGLVIAPLTQTSASDGTVQTVVSAGTVHTVVRVTASIASPALSTQSSQLTVTTGLPASAAFSIAVGAATYGSTASTLACPNVEAADIDGVTVPVTVRLADRYNNPVPDGTSVAFTTNGGHIVGNCTTPATTSGDGTCTVTWTSANPRPALNSDTPNLLVANRATVLATTIGEESFTDVYGSGFWQTGDPFADLGEPYRDDNENGQYDVNLNTTPHSGEYFLDFNHNGTRDAGTGTFVGITCTGITTGSTCSSSSLAIGASHLIIMSTSAAQVSLLGATGSFTTASGSTIYAPSLLMPVSIAAVAASSGPPPVAASPATTYGGTIAVQVQDNSCTKDTNGHCSAPGNSMAAGTAINAVLDNTSIGTVNVTPVTVGCNSNLGGLAFEISFTSGTTTGSGTITITVTSPSGSVTRFPIAVKVQ